MKKMKFKGVIMTLILLAGTLNAENVENQKHTRKINMGLRKLKDRVEAEGNLNARLDGEQRTVLMFAASHADTNLIDEVVGKGVDVNLADIKGKTALMYACQSGDEASVRMLISKGAHINLRDIESCQTALIIAARNGQYGAVKGLVENGADLDLRDRDGGTALSRAVAKGHKEIADYFLKCGASTNIILKETSFEVAKLARRELPTLENAMDVWAVARGKNEDDIPVWSELVGYLEKGVPLSARNGMDVFGNPIILRSYGKGPAIHPLTRDRLKKVVEQHVPDTEFWGKFLPDE